MTHWALLLRRHDRVWRAKRYPLARRETLCKKIHLAMIRECVKLRPTVLSKGVKKSDYV